MQEIFRVTVLRDESEADWTLSDFHFNGVHKGVGVEDEKREVKIKGETRIANDLYDMELRYSPKFSNSYLRDDNGNIKRSKYVKTDEDKAKYHTPHEMIWVRHVVNFQYILWHWGNTDDDTGGCYCVGTSKGVFGKQKGVTESRKKYEEIYPILWRAIKEGKVTVEYKDKPINTI